MADPVGRLISFLGELKRRKVYRVTIVYVLVAAGAIELVDIILPASRLPDWSDELLFALALFGLPVAVVLAWAFEVTPDGVQRTSTSAADRPAPSPSPPDGAAAEPELRPRAIAVLPFETLGEEKATAFTDAIHGDVLTRLSKISDLFVISRTSVLRYRDPDRSLPAIARELGVSWILSGEVQELPDRVQVNARLVNAREDRQTWAENYRRELTAADLFQIQAGITKSITAELRARLTSEERRAVDRAPTKDLEAYRLSAQARRSLDQRTEGGMRRAVDSFRRATARDATYTLAWVGLADALTLLHDYGYEDADAVLPQSEAAIARALELDPSTAEAHASLGLLHTTRREGPAAVRELERAADLRPSYADAHSWLSWIYKMLGHAEEALQSSRRAVALDPLSMEALGNLVLDELAGGDAEGALREVARLRGIQPDLESGPFLEGLTLYHMGRFAEAIATLQDASVAWAGSGGRLTQGLAEVASGRSARARDMLRSFREAGDFFAVGTLHAAFGEEEQAFDAFQAVVDWSYWPVLAVHHFYPRVLGPLRGDPRYQALLREVDRSWGVESSGDTATSAASLGEHG